MPLTDPARMLAGRREAALLEVPSVRRMADVLAVRCREPSWVRTLVASLDRFKTATGTADLDALLAAARADPVLADRSLAAFAYALDGHPDAAVAALAMGAKVWFRLGGVAVAWRPLPAAVPAREVPAAGAAGPDRVALLSLIGSGLHLAASSAAAGPPSASPSCPSRPAARSSTTWSAVAAPGSTPGRTRRWWPVPTAVRRRGRRSRPRGAARARSSGPGTR